MSTPQQFIGLTNPPIVGGENHIGIVGESQAQIQVNQTVTTGSAYAANQVIGGSSAGQSITGALRIAGQTSTLLGITVTDKSNQKSELSLVFFTAAPTSVQADKANYTGLPTDVLLCQANVEVLTTDYKSIGTGSPCAVATKGNLWIPMKAAACTTIFFVIVSQGTPTFTGANDLTVTFDFLQN